MTPTTKPMLKDHFTGRDATVRAIYDALLEASRAHGPVKIEVKKTSIHLVHHTAFAGVATRRAWLVLTLKSTVERKSPRVHQQLRASAGRWYSEIRLDSPRDVDRELRAWIADAYALAGPRVSARPAAAGRAASRA